MYLGIDTHKEYSQVAVVDGDGELQKELHLPNDQLGELAQAYAGAEAALEASLHSRPLYERLDEHLEVTLVHPSGNRPIAQATHKTDRADAKKLALLLKAEMLTESHVPDEDIQELRDLVRARKSLVEEQTAEKNRLRAVLARTDNTYQSELFGPNGREYLAELSLSEADRAIVQALLEVIETYDDQIERLDENIERRLLNSPTAELLLSIPGVGKVTAAVVIAEVGDIARFDRDKELVSYAGLDPVVSQSGQKEVRGSISKEGPGTLRWALVQSSLTAIHHDEYLGNFYTRLKERKNHHIAIVATARKMLVSIFHMLKQKEPYNPPGVSA